MAGLRSRTLWAWSGREQDDDPIFPLKVIRRLTHARRSNTTTTNFHQLPGTAHRLLPTNRAPSSPEAASELTYYVDHCAAATCTLTSPGNQPTESHPTGFSGFLQGGRDP